MTKCGIKAESIAEQLEVHRGTVFRWISQIKSYGIHEFKRRYRNSKKGKRKRYIDPKLKRLILKIREDFKHCCGQKIQYLLLKFHNIQVSLTSIYRVLKTKWRLRSRYKKNFKRGTVQKSHKKGDAIQVDTVDFGGFYAFTAIDTYKKEASV